MRTDHVIAPINTIGGLKQNNGLAPTFHNMLPSIPYIDIRYAIRNLSVNI